MVKVVQAAEGVFKIELPMPYSMNHVNVYLVEGSPLTLIDTGPIMEGVEDALHGSLESRGYSADRLERIVVTHSHPDHMGLAARLKAASGAELVCHRLASDSMSDYQGSAIREREYLIGMAEMLGLPSELMEMNRALMDGWLDVAESAEADRMVEDGDTLESDRLQLQVIYTPGHSIDHIVLYDAESGLIFTGDHLLAGITPNPDVYLPWMSEKLSGLPDYLESLARLKQLQVRLALPGHGDWVTDVSGRIEEIFLHHEERKSYIVDTLRGREMTVLELALDMISFVAAELSPTNVFLAMREILGHMVILEDEQRVTREVRKGTWYYGAN